MNRYNFKDIKTEDVPIVVDMNQNWNGYIKKGNKKNMEPDGLGIKG